MPPVGPHEALLAEMFRLSPAVDPQVLWGVYRILTDEADPDALLIAADALGEVSTEMAVRGHFRCSAGLSVLADLLGKAAAQRAAAPSPAGV